MAEARVFLASLTTLAAGSIIAVAGAFPAGAAPPSDGQGYIESTARCASVADTVVFGSTAASRVAICDTADGLQYRGVRVRDGARLIAPASKGAGGAYVADRDGITYTVTSSDLVISAGSRTLREETMVDFHGASATTEPAPVESTPEPTTSDAPTLDDLPPLPAEVGGSGS